MSNLPIKNRRNGVEILVRGTVQGVGFRPFIYNLASRLTISGTVTNTSDGVVIKATAQDDKLRLFLQAIKEQSPPLAKITSIESRTLSTDLLTGPFSILPSVAGSSTQTAIPPDICLCADCKREITNPQDRRYFYPFTNCTNCGPRLTIVDAIPYDRPKTSMSVFPMCVQCTKEYHDPTNRRFHAQPNACPDCGPSVSLHDPDGSVVTSSLPLAATAVNLSQGKIMAIRGIGGFHLCVDGYNRDAVALLRSRKGRPDKPLAIMVADICTAKKLCQLTTIEAKLLTSPEHPIVLLKRKDTSELADNLAPNIGEIGVMLPYTPLHHILFQQPNCPNALVMTSGNMSGTPICTDNNEAIKILGPICDQFLLHNREIVTRVDDSVVKAVGETPLLFRRARGYVPAPVEIAWNLPRTLGCGGGLKSTFTLGQNKTLCTSQHIGNLDNLESYDFYLESIEHFKKLFQLEPEIVVSDLHPDYMSSRYAAEQYLTHYRVQHHHAHAAAVMAEHGIDEPVLAIVLDGTGYGDDGTSWGGEILKADLTSFERLGHLSHLHLPGGDMAATEPWRMGISALYSAYGEDGIAINNIPAPLRKINRESLTVLSAMLTNGFNSPLSSSCGRLFDAVASLLGIRQHVSYEGQAAMELETLAQRAMPDNRRAFSSQEEHNQNPNDLTLQNGMWEISSAGFIKTVFTAIQAGEAPEKVAFDFHSMLINSISRLTDILSRQTGIRQVVLSGGCMQNSILLEGLSQALSYYNLKVFTGVSLPINDGAISFGQAVIGGLRHVSSNSNEGN